MVGCQGVGLLQSLVIPWLKVPLLSFSLYRKGLASSVDQTVARGSPSSVSSLYGLDQSTGVQLATSAVGETIERC